MGKTAEMNKFGFATVLASGLITAVLGLAGPAHADIVTNSPTPQLLRRITTSTIDNADTTNGFLDQPF